MSLDDNTEFYPIFQGISMIAFDNEGYKIFFDFLRSNDIEMPSSLDVLQVEFYSIYDRMNKFNNISLHRYMLQSIAYYTIRSAEFRDEAMFDEFNKMASFIRLEYDRIAIFERMIDTRNAAVKNTKTSVPVRLLLLQFIIASPDVVQQLSAKGKIQLYQIILNCDQRALNGYENSKALGSKEGTYILKPEHHKEVQELIETLKTL